MRLRDPTITLETPSPHHGFHPAASQWRFSNEISCNMSLHVVVRSLSRVRLCDSKDCSTPGFPLSFAHSQSFLKLMPIKSVMPSNPLILFHSLLLLPSIFLSIRVFSNELALCIRWPKYQSFRFSISPSNEYSGFIFFRVHWFDLLAVQGTLKSLFQHHSSKGSVLQCSAFFMFQLSHPYMTTEKKNSFDYTDLSQQSDVSVF